MRAVRRVSATIALFVLLTGCAVATHAATSIPSLPTCDKVLLELNHLSNFQTSKTRIPQESARPMRLCRYRWNNGENRLVLIADIALPVAPISLLRTLSKLKNVNEVYPANSVFSCPMSQGNVDLVILRAATGSALKLVEVQRDGCRRVLLAHPGSVSYSAYLSKSQLFTELDAINATLTVQTKILPTIRVTPFNGLHNNQQILVQILGAFPEGRFRISECATAADANLDGCGKQLAAQPFVDTDASGAGATMFNVSSQASTMPYSTVALRSCTKQCVIMAAGTDIEGKAVFVHTSLIFSR